MFIFHQYSSPFIKNNLVFQNLYMFTKLLIVVSTVEWARQYWVASKLWVSLGMKGPE